MAPPIAELSWILLLFLFLVPELPGTVQKENKMGKICCKWLHLGIFSCPYKYRQDNEEVQLSFTSAELQYEQSLFRDVILH